MQLIEIKEIKGKITLKSGLHVGAGDTEMHIGGTDNPIVKHPHTQQPYIPGSSLKGKVRSLLEMKSGLMNKTEGAPLQAKDLKGLKENAYDECLNILKLFGTSGVDSDEITKIGPSRASFADCPLNIEWLNEANKKRLALTEVKAENFINRIKGTAEHPRFIERVPSGAVFDFHITIKILAEEDNGLLDYLLLGLKLLEMDALGGNGSRGYGRISFEFEDSEIKNRFDNINPF